MDSKSLNEELAQLLGRSEAEISELSSRLADVIGELVANGDSIIIPAFGSFEPKKRAERVSVHPSSGKKLLIPPKLSIVFKPSSSLKTRVR